MNLYIQPNFIQSLPRSPFHHYHCLAKFNMTPAIPRNKDSTHTRHRSHKGCWTCKRKRIQCDETHPSCRRCTEKGLSCEGYEIRLRWGAGIASRGRFSGADKPVAECIPPSSKRRWDLRAKSERECENDRQAKAVFVLDKVGTSAEGERFEILMVRLKNADYGRTPLHAV